MAQVGMSSGNPIPGQHTEARAEVSPGPTWVLVDEARVRLLRVKDGF